MTKKEKTNPRGRPSTYDPKYAEELVELMAQGLLDCEIQAKWSMTREKFYRWRREIPEFREAYEEGYAKCEAWWIQNVFKKMVDGSLIGKHSFNSAIAIANNKFGWKDKNSQENTNITINVIPKSKDELLEFIKTELKEQDIIELDESQYQSIEFKPKE